jgi:hypothetical protein
LSILFDLLPCIPGKAGKKVFQTYWRRFESSSFWVQKLLLGLSWSPAGAACSALLGLSLAIADYGPVVSVKGCLESSEADSLPSKSNVSSFS